MKGQSLGSDHGSLLCPGVYFLYEATGGVGGHQSIIGRGLTCSNLCFKKITLVAVWRKDLVLGGGGRVGDSCLEGKKEPLTWTDTETVFLRLSVS